MSERVLELLLTEIAEAKLGRRGISETEAHQTVFNDYVLVRNPRSREAGRRRFLIGSTDGRGLTLVVEQTLDPTTWLVVTAWESAPAERRLLDS